MNLIVRSFDSEEISSAVKNSFVREICEWERQEYGEGKHRTPDQLSECANKNPFGLFLAFRNDELLGYADIWQLDKQFYDGLRVGKILEEALSANVVQSTSDVPSSCWYIGSIIVSAKLRAQNKVGAALTFASLCNELPNFFQNNSHFPAFVLGVGSSPFGAKLLNRWKFSPVVSDDDAIDLRPRFEKNMRNPDDALSFHVGHRRP
ncbi:hypothetical protein [Caballeronia grimmiae]|uniref:hypothetical protein n=1 Tax=Caballeronia grimmiae TaxID=1071679 RepID=UPI0038BDCADF